MRLRLTLQTAGGCTVEIEGDVGFSTRTDTDGESEIIYTGFTGTVSISGGRGCPNVTATFKSGRAPKGKELTISVDNRRISKLSKITWQGDSKLVPILNEGDVNQKLCRAIRSKAKTAKK